LDWNWLVLVYGENRGLQESTGIMKTIDFKIEDVITNPNNPRIIKDDKFKKLVASIVSFPDMLKLRPIVVNAEHVVLGGNMRLKACVAAGLKTVPVIVADKLTEAQQKEFVIKDNTSGGEWDFEDLLENWDTDLLDDWGLDFPDGFLDSEDEETSGDDEVPGVVENPETVLGDLWELGDHRLLCGDSTEITAVEKLMDGEKADMVFTDPPYGIKIVGGNGKVGGDNAAKNGVYSDVIGDDTTDTAEDFYNTCISLGFENFIIWGGNYFVGFLPFSASWIVWDKRGDMNSNNFADGEMAWCSFHTRVRIYKQIWNGMIREGESEKRVHPTQKPIKLLSDIINDNIEGKIIYDGFLGSGSTLISSELSNKKCYGMELDPKYCDVIVKRYIKFCKENDKNYTVKLNGADYSGNLLDA